MGNVNGARLSLTKQGGKNEMTVRELYSANSKWTLDTVVKVHDPDSTNSPSVMTARNALNRYSAREITSFFIDNTIYLLSKQLQ